MTDSFENRGRFWLPEEPDRKHPGLIRFDPAKGITVDVEGIFSADQLSFGKRHIPIMHGILERGEEVSLFTCDQGNARAGAEIPFSQYFCETLVKGCLLNQNVGLPIRRVEVGYSSLAEWVNSGGFQVKSAKRSPRLTIRFDAPQHQILARTDYFDVSLGTTHSCGPWTLVQKEFTFSQEWFIRFDFREDQCLDGVIELVHSFQQFLTLAMGDKCNPLYITLSLEKDQKAIREEWAALRHMTSSLPDGQRIRVHRPNSLRRVHAFWRHTSFGKPAETIRPDEMVFTITSAGDRLANAIVNWFRIAPLLKPALDLHLGARFSNQIYDQHYFSSMAQSVETYHRRTMQDSEEDKKLHQAKIDRILAAMGEANLSSQSDTSGDQSADAQWLIEATRHLYEPNLRMRLKGILDRFPEQTRELIGNSDRRSRFSQKVLKSRNYYTHFGEDTYPDAAHGRELTSLARTLSTLFQMCLIADLGFGSREFDQLVLLRRRWP